MVAYIDFTEQVLELGVNYGAVGGLSYKTTILKDGAENEQRNCEWWIPLGRWQIGTKTLLESQTKEIEEVQYLRDFFGLRKGKKQGFRFKDWSDYQAVNQLVGISDGSRTQYQLYKNYIKDGYQFKRPITKPIAETVEIFLDGVSSPLGWTLDDTTGVITFTAIPANEITISASFEFHVPVWFETDKISFQQEGIQVTDDGKREAIYKLGSVSVAEQRIPLALPYEGVAILPQVLQSTLNLGIIPLITFEDKFATSEIKLSNGFCRKDSNINEPESYLTIQSRTFNSQELNEIQKVFLNVKGRAYNFKLQVNGVVYEARFNTDVLNIRFDGYDERSGDKLFVVTNLVFEVLENLPLPTLPNFTATPTFYDWGLRNSENTNELNSPYQGGANSGAGAGAGSGSGSAGGGGGAV